MVDYWQLSLYAAIIVIIISVVLVFLGIGVWLFIGKLRTEANKVDKPINKLIIEGGNYPTENGISARTDSPTLQTEMISPGLDVYAKIGLQACRYSSTTDESDDCSDILWLNNTYLYYKQGDPPGTPRGFLFTIPAQQDLLQSNTIQYRIIYQFSSDETGRNKIGNEVIAAEHLSRSTDIQGVAEYIESSYLPSGLFS